MMPMRLRENSPPCLDMKQVVHLVLALLVSSISMSAHAARPTAPIFSIAAIGNGKVTATWRHAGHDESSITHYKVQWKSSNQEYEGSRQVTVTANGLNTVDGVNYEHEITGLTNEVQYTLRVVAVNEYGDGHPSVEKQATPLQSPSELIRRYIEDLVVTSH